MDRVTLIKDLAAELRRLNTHYDLTEHGKRANLHGTISMLLLANRHYIADALSAQEAQEK